MLVSATLMGLSVLAVNCLGLVLALLLSINLSVLAVLKYQ